MGKLLLTIAVLGGIISTFFIIIRLLMRTGSLKSNREFIKLKRPEDLSEYPLVTIVVPVRNEERNIKFCLEYLLALDYPRFEILVIDDHSTDKTVEIVENVLERSTCDAKVRLFLLEKNTKNESVEWTYGKSCALWYGANRSLGEWILFVDADTRQKPDTLWRAMSFSKLKYLQALSMSGTIINKGICGGVLEAVILPVIFLVIPWHLINKSNDPTAWMNGNFILYERNSYFSINGHRAVAAFPQEDIALALLSKEKKVPFRFLPVSSAYECYDYIGLREAFRGWTRRMVVSGERLKLSRKSYFIEAGILFIVAVWPVLAAIASLMIPLEGYYIFGISFTTLALSHLGLVILIQSVIRGMMKMSIWPALFAPLGAIFGIGVVIGGYRGRYVKKTAEQRGRSLIVKNEGE